MNAPGETLESNRKALKRILLDIIGSTGNTRVKEKANGKSPLRFKYPETFEVVLKELDRRDPNRSGEDAKPWEELKKVKDDLEKFLNDIYSSASSSYAAFLADTDQGNSTDLLRERDKKGWEELSGTEQFMSLQVINAIKLGSKHFLQSPADDLESFFYVSLCEIFCNQNTSKDLSQIEADMKSFLLSGNGREMGLVEYLYTSANDLTTQPVIEAQPVMDEWNRQLSVMYYDIKKRANIHVVLTKDAVDCRWRGVDTLCALGRCENSADH